MIKTTKDFIMPKIYSLKTDIGTMYIVAESEDEALEILSCRIKSDIYCKGISFRVLYNNGSPIKVAKDDKRLSREHYVSQIFELELWQVSMDKLSVEDYLRLKLYC